MITRRGKGFVLFLLYETLVKVFAITIAIIQNDFRGILTALRNNTGGVSVILDFALREKMKGKKKTSLELGMRTKFELGRRLSPRLAASEKKGLV